MNDTQAEPGQVKLQQAGLGKWRRPILWLLSWVLLAYPVVRSQLVEIGVANRVPGAALALDGGHARALALLATAVQLQGHQQEAIVLARRALLREPMNVPALRTLGLALEQTGDEAGADRIMFLAARLGWRDAALQLWLLKGYALKEDLRGALRRANALARIGRLPEVTSPVFNGSIVDDGLRLALAQEMADRPPWRSSFFFGLLQMPADRMPYVTRLIADLARVGSPIDPGERALYLNRLVQVDQGRAALAYWLHDQRMATMPTPWNGGFAQVAPRGALAAPFEWQLIPESIGVAAIVPGARGEQLSVSPGRDFKGGLVTQTVVLRQGRYRVTARVGGDAASMGLHWTLHCLPDGRELTLDVPRDVSELAEAAFDVPAGCNAQSLTIDMASNGEGGAGDVTVDDVAIRRIG